MNYRLSTLLIMLLPFFFFGCGFLSKPEPKPKPVQKPETFLTLADLSGRTTLAEDSPDVRVITVKSKAFIKRNDIRAAKAKALEVASIQAVDNMVRELLPPETYNRNYEKINQYMGTNVEKYIVDKQVYTERKIFDDKYYGVAAGIKLNRQQVLVALQKDLNLINQSQNGLITVITSKKDIDLSGAGLRFEDIETALMKQIQTDLNQRGLRAMDYFNAMAALKLDESKKAKIQQLSKEQFMTAISGSSAKDASMNTVSQQSGEFYGIDLNILKEVAKVVVEVNIFAVSGNIQGDVSLQLNVTATNISTSTGGAFANSMVNVARRGGPNVIASAMIAGLVQDAYEEMQQQFIPQVIKEMSTISIGGNKLIAYELILRGFDRRAGNRIRRVVQKLENDDFRYIDIDNSIEDMITLKVRFAGKSSELADKIFDELDAAGILVDVPIVAPELTDLVFNKLPPETK